MKNLMDRQQFICESHKVDLSDDKYIVFDFDEDDVKDLVVSIIQDQWNGDLNALQRDVDKRLDPPTPYEDVIYTMVWKFMSKDVDIVGIPIMDGKNLEDIKFNVLDLFNAITTRDIIEYFQNKNKQPRP